MLPKDDRADLFRMDYSNILYTVPTAVLCSSFSASLRYKVKSFEECKRYAAAAKGKGTE